MRLVLYGNQGSGKTSTADLLGKIAEKDGITYTRLSFAEPLKREIADALATFTYPASRIYDEMQDEKKKIKWRRVMQFWGTEIRRDIFGNEYWVDKLLAAVPSEDSADQLVIVDDARFYNEEVVLRVRGFSFVRLTGRGDTDRAAHHHASERDWQRWRPDFVVPWSDDQQEKADRIWAWLHRSDPANRPTRRVSTQSSND